MSISDFEMVEKLREKAGVSYEDAKTALEQNGGDMLDALIALERQGKVAPPAGGTYTSKPEEPVLKAPDAEPAKKDKGETFGEMWNRFLKWCGRVLHAGNTHYFEVRRNGEDFMSLPVTVLVLLLMAFGITVPLLVLGLFLGCRYSIEGPKTANINVNDVMDSAANAAESIKNGVMGRPGGGGGNE